MGELHHPDRETFMSESTTEAPVTPETEQPTATTEPPATDATDTDAERDWKAEAEKWKTFARKHEDAAKANAAKAQRLDEFEESQKTELQKAADRAAEAEAKAADLEMRALRAEVAATKGVPAHLLSGATQDELIESADALLAFRGEKPPTDFGAGGRGADIGHDKPTQLTKNDIDRLTREGRSDEIVKAKSEGRLNTLLGIE